MNEQDQRTIIAELDGWLDVKEYTYSFDYMGEKGEYKRLQGRSEGNLGHLVGLPNYLYSYDAIIPVIQKLFGDDQHKWFRFRDALELGKPSMMLIQYYSTATPSQLAEALLRAIGKWKE